MWFEFKGINSNDFNTSIDRMDIMPRAERREESVSVPGRDGDFTVSDDTYNTIPYTITCRWGLDITLRDINTWLNGNGDLIRSIEADKKYKARVSGILNQEFFSGYWRADVLFIVQPFIYEVEPETVTFEMSGMINNPGTRFSLPIIKAYGAGTLMIGDTELVISSTPGEDYVVINSEIEEAYYGTNNRGNKVSGKFPRLEPGLTEITLDGLTKVEIQGNWRWY